MATGKKKVEERWVSKYDAELSAIVLEARIKGELTQKDLADRMGTTQSSVARAEGGAVPPSHSFLKKVALAIGSRLEPPRLICSEEVNASSFNNVQIALITNTLDFVIKKGAPVQRVGYGSSSQGFAVRSSASTRSIPSPIGV